MSDRIKRKLAVNGNYCRGCKLQLSEICRDFVSYPHHFFFLHLGKEKSLAKLVKEI